MNIETFLLFFHLTYLYGALRLWATPSRQSSFKTQVSCLRAPVRTGNAGPRIVGRTIATTFPAETTDRPTTDDMGGTALAQACEN
jgi:hypothetical protein